MAWGGGGGGGVGGARHLKPPISDISEIKALECC